MESSVFQSLLSEQQEMIIFELRFTLQQSAILLSISAAT